MKAVGLLFGAGTVVLTAAGIFRGAEPQGTKATAARRYVVECWLVLADPTGKEHPVVAPKVTLEEGQQATVRDVSKRPLPGKTRQASWIEEGTSIELCVFQAEDGQRFVDANFQLSGRPATKQREQKPAVGALLSMVPTEWLWQRGRDAKTASRPGSEGVRIVEPALVTHAVRVVEPLRLGEKIVVPATPWGRFEVRVTETTYDGRVIMGGVTPRIIIQEEEEEKLGISPL